MATRNVVVALSARTDAYVAAMNRARTATGQLSAESVRNMRTAGTALQHFGKTASVAVTAPLTAIAGASVKMSMDFERSFSHLEGLANVPAAEIERLKEAVLDLAGETAVAPQALAEGLYFAASAGLNATQSMEVLGMAARGSASGLGDVQSIVGLLAGAMRSYGFDVLSAAEATDILVATVREGRSDPQELAGALGRITPIASALGVSFGELGGVTAYMSNILGNTDETITALRGVMLSLLDPSQQGRKALEGLGLTADDLKNTIREEGLVAAFQLLKDHGLNPTSDAMSNLFEDNRALNGAMILLNDTTGTLTTTVDRVKNSVGAAGDAFGAVADDSGFKFRQAMVEIQTAMIRIGDIIAPLAATVASTMADVAQAFGTLPPEAQKAVIAFAGLVAIGGPLIMFAGSIIKNFGVVAAVFSKLPAPILGVAGALAKIGLVAGTALAVWDILGEGHLNAGASIDTSGEALGRNTAMIYYNSVAAAEAGIQVDALADAHLALSNAIAENADEELSAAFTRLNISADEYLDTIIMLQETSGGGVEVQRMFSRALGLTTEQQREYYDSMRAGTLDIEAFAEKHGLAADDIREMNSALSEVTHFALEEQEAINDMALAFLDMEVKQGGASKTAVRMAEDLEGSRNAAGNALPVYMAYVQMLHSMDPAQAQAALSSENFAATLGSLPPEIAALLDPLNAAGEATTEFAMRQANAIDIMSDAQQAYEDSQTAIGFYTEALDQVFGPTQNLARAQMAVWDSFHGFSEAIDHTTHSIELNTAEGVKNRGVVLDWADNIMGLARANLEAGMSVENVTAEFEHNIETLLDSAEAAGMNRGAVEQLLITYGMVPANIDTAISIAGDALARWRVERHIAMLDQIPEEEATAIEALIDQGSFALAEQRLVFLARRRYTTISAYVNVISSSASREGTSKLGGGWGGAGASEGRYIGGPQVIPVGEGGRPEVVFPLTKPDRIQALWDDPRISGPMMAALSSAGAPARASATPVTAAAPSYDIRVYVGNKEITDIVRTEFRQRDDRQLAGVRF